MAVAGYSKYQKTLSLIGDLILINVAFFTGYYLRFNHMINFDKYELITLLLIYNFSWWLIITQSSFTLGVRGIHLDSILLRYFRNMLIHGAIIFLTIVFFRFYGLSRLMIGYAFGIQLVLLLVWRISFFKLLNAYRKAGYNYRNVIILGTNENAIGLYKTITTQTAFGYKFLGFFEIPERIKPIGECPVYSLDEYPAFTKEHGVDEMFCTLTDEYTDEITRAIQFCENNLIRFKLVPDFKKFIRKKVTIDFIEGTPLILLRPEPMESLFARVIKRLFDMVFSFLIILLVLSWMIPLMALLIKLDSKGPVFFVQWRTVKDNRNFKMIKFRSMRMNSEAHEKQAKKGDPRITALGRFLRKSNIDELPQFLNVLTGSMSVVGPRPHMLQHTREYSEIINKYMVRHFVKPGLTGWAQVNGYRGETTEPEQMQKRVEYDVWYLENWTFLLDIFIIFRTIGNMLKGEENAG